MTGLSLRSQYSVDNDKHERKQSVTPYTSHTHYYYTKKIPLPRKYLYGLNY